ncbi:MAG: hypothetical protein J7521_12445 [Caulobacter sp.]|nr:hypothetical protein [Caulobacter sp.]
MLARCLAICLLLATPTLAKDALRTERVEFAKGTSSKTIASSIRGYGAVRYVVRVEAGQTLNASLKTSNPSNYFNVTAPGAEAAAFVGSQSGNRFTVTAPSTGDYAVEVYLMRNAARRNAMANYTLSIGVSQ